ncbi:hypothetical protein [Paenibacillus lutrae]|uniref:Uncharacterized protein n=1 Tax=Paenibacillus lutrae TaxID=2078573 RepID=A0A7X3FMD8_9BACL|nr:hypothetical protein [Paenibacillus lutrae]MVP02134.1 hypothetical protein [Paenibacillus lutrae]
MQINLNEQAYQGIAKLLRDIQIGKAPKHVQRIAEDNLKQLRDLRGGQPVSNGITLKAEDSLRLATVLDKVANQDISRLTSREAGNVLRHLENHRVHESPNWEMKELKEIGWDEIHADVIKIGMNEMDVQAIDKVLGDLAEGKEDENTKSISNMASTLFKNYHANGNDANHVMKMSPELFKSVTRILDHKGPVTDELRQQSSSLLKEMGIEKILHKRDRETSDIVEKLIKYLAEMLVKLKEFVIGQDRQHPELQQPAKEQNAAYNQYHSRLLESVGQEVENRLTPNLKAQVNELQADPEPENNIAYMNQFKEQLGEYQLSPSAIENFAKGATTAYVMDEEMSFGEKRNLIGATSRGSFELVQEIQKERIADSSKQSLKDVLFKEIGDKIPGKFPSDQELNSTVSDFRIKGDTLWYKNEHDFKAIKLYDGPYTPEERDSTMQRALYDEDKLEKQGAKDEIQRFVKAESKVIERSELSIAD